MDSDWMNAMADMIAGVGVRVVRFEFSYMAARRSGTRKPPSPANILIGEYIVAMEAAPVSGTLLIGGKSLGGRMASMVAGKLFDAGRIGGLVCLGYPFHPPGQPAKLRTDHLEKLTCPTLIFQGERDPFGTKAEVSAYTLSRSVDIRWMADGDHELKPRKSAGVTLAEHMQAVATAIAAF